MWKMQGLLELVQSFSTFVRIAGTNTEGGSYSSSGGATRRAMMGT